MPERNEPKVQASVHFWRMVPRGGIAMAVSTGRLGPFFHRSSEDLSTAGQGDHPSLLHNRVKRCPAALERRCRLRGVQAESRILDQTITGFDPKQNWRSVEMQVSLHLTVIPWLLEFCRLRIDPGPEEDGRR